MANVVEIILKGTDLTAPGFGSAISRMGAVGRAASSMFAVFAGGAAIGAVGSLAAMAARSIELADEMGTLAQKAGIPVEQFSQLAHSAKLADVATGTLQTGIKKLSEEMVKQGRGSESVLAQLLAQADVFAKMEDGAEKTALAVQLFGRSGQELIPLLNQGSDAIREQMQESDALGLTISKDFAEQADVFRDNLDRIRASSGELGKGVAQMLMPELVRLSEWAADWVKRDGNALEQSINFIASTFAGFKQVIEDTRGALESLSRLALKFQIPGLSPRGGGAAPGITPTELSGVRIHPAGGTPGINPAQDYGGAGFAPPEMSAPITPIASGLKSEAEAIAEAQQMYEQHEAWMIDMDARERGRVMEAKDYFLQHEEWMREEDQRTAEAKFRNQQLVLRGLASTMSDMQTVAKAFGKKGFEAYKVFASAQAVIDSFAAANAAYRALAAIPIVGPALGAAAAAAALAAGMANVAMINSQKPQAHGGLGFVPEDATYMLKAGEAVLAPDQNRELMEFLRSNRGSGTEVYRVEVDSAPIFELIRQGSRDGRMQISARAIAA